MTERSQPRPFLKKGAGQARILQRSAILNPPPTELSSPSSSDKAQTSTQSLPLIENLSPITKEPAINIRPTTAETGDSGVRDINLQISPSNRSGSVRTTVTTYHRKSPPKPPEAEDAPANETNISEGEQCFQKFRQFDPDSARKAEEIGLQLNSSTSSHTSSYTSLDRIKTPPIGNKTKQNESDEISSNYSAEVYAPSRSKGSASVGTSRAHDALDEIENDDSVEVIHGDSAATLRSHIDSLNIFNSRLYRTSHNNSMPPLFSQNYDQDTPLNSKNRNQLFKSHSSSSLEHRHRRPLSHLGQIPRNIRKLLQPPQYDIHPAILESPDIVNGLGTPQASSTKNNIFCHTPMLPQDFIQKEEGKIVESLAEQLRALIVLFDTGMDERNHRFDTLKNIYAEKSKALKRKEQEIKQKMIAEENKLIGAKAKLKLESDKMKQSDGTLKKLEAELKEVKTKCVDTSRILSDVRQAKNQLEQRLKKAEEELQKEKEKTMKWESLNGRLKNELDLERMKKQLLAKHSTAQPQPTVPQPQPREQLRRPLRTIPPQNHQNPYGNPFSKAKETVTPPFFQQPQGQQQFQPQRQHQQEQPQTQQQQQQPPPQRRLTNTSTSSVASSTKNVHWSSPIAEHRDISARSESFNFSSLQIYIPEDIAVTNIIDNPLFIEEQYSQFGSYRVMKECGCETLRYENGDLQYCCLIDVNVNICYFEENGQLTVTLPGGYVLNSFQSMQLELIREGTNEKSIVKPDGIRYEFINVQNEENQIIDKILSKDEGKRRNVDGTEEMLIDPVTRRSNEDYVEQFDDHIVFYCPGFTVTRSLQKDLGGGVVVRVFTDDPKKTWKMTLCPEHKVFYIKHHFENHFSRCTFTENRCCHLKK